MSWYTQQDSNLRPSAPEADALFAELWVHEVGPQNAEAPALFRGPGLLVGVWLVFLPLEASGPTGIRLTLSTLGHANALGPLDRHGRCDMSIGVGGADGHGSMFLLVQPVVAAMPYD